MNLFSISLWTLLALAPEKKVEPIAVEIAVIEASKVDPFFDPKLTPLREAIVGYPGARVLDQLTAQVELGASVQLEIMKGARMLRTKLLEVKPDGSVRLEIAIDAIKFKAATTHQKGRATVLVAHKTGPDTALFFAVTPKL